MDRLVAVQAGSRLHTHSAKRLFRVVVARIDLMFERARTRQQLAELTDQQLADIGISHSDRIAELDRPFWR
ncbi:DUF1127 domain-containing protein [Pseudomonas sp. LS1212]|uniref:DUF1127 domain-containing protein n=1 Tax=Pseudomonas sp. LS1212 TaxID=2972478 RepID=UPI00215C56C7|nr:DUF1127 domain-containing protein [Pseudomonas sp. LS1212]UVJ44136.1 DUF1127 domain-containing protein [Pseudomonas sp. LS1212]